MARAEKRPRRSLRGFLILVALVVISGAILWSQGDLISPVQSTAMVISMSSGEDGFAMISDRSALPGSAETVAETAADAHAEVSTETSVETSSTAAEQPEAAAVTTGTMTLETFTAELATAGVDVEAVSASMSAEGRSLENLLAVVNSGRTTVADLAARLSGDSAQPPSETESETESTSLLDFRWEELGSVAYNLWVILAATAAVIVIARPAGWVVNRMKRVQRPVTP